VIANLIVCLGFTTFAHALPIDITSFGAIPNDGKDDTKAVRKAIDQCRRQPGSNLLFPPGRYDFSKEHTNNKNQMSLSFTNCQDLTIVAQQAVCVFHGLTRAFGFLNCPNLTIHGLVIDWDRLPFSVGRIVAAGEKYFDVEVFEEFPISGGEQVQAFMDYDPKTKLPRRHGLDAYHQVTRTELIGPQLLRVHLKTKLDVQPSYWVVLRHQVYGYNAFELRRCSDISVNNVTVYTAPGMGLYAGDCENITLDGFRVLVKPQTRRLMSTTADATHFKSCTGTIRMNNCVFQGMGDDAGNVSSLYLTVREKMGKRSVSAGHNLKIYAPPDVGDTIEFTSYQTLLPYATQKVKAVEKLPADALCRITFTEPLPTELKTGDVLGNVTKVAKVRISNCTVGNNRARGFLIQTRDAVIENCTFKNCTSGGVWVMTEVVHFFEAVSTRNVVVRNNTFINCNYTALSGVGVLSVFAYLADFKYPSLPGVHRNIVLEGNTIRGADNSGIFIAGTDGIVIRNNRLEQTCRKPVRDEGRSAIYITSSRNVQLTGNRAEQKDQGLECKSPCLISPNCEKKTITIKNNHGF
jgi:parallel beta-helix repeat protein